MKERAKVSSSKGCKAPFHTAVVTCCAPSFRPRISTRVARRGARRNAPPALVYTSTEGSTQSTAFGSRNAEETARNAQTNGHPLYLQISGHPLNMPTGNYRAFSERSAKKPLLILQREKMSKRFQDRPHEAARAVAGVGMPPSSLYGAAKHARSMMIFLLPHLFPVRDVLFIRSHSSFFRSLYKGSKKVNYELRTTYRTTNTALCLRQI